MSIFGAKKAGVVRGGFLPFFHAFFAVDCDCYRGLSTNSLHNHPILRSDTLSKRNIKKPMSTSRCICKNVFFVVKRCSPVSMHRSMLALLEVLERGPCEACPDSAASDTFDAVVSAILGWFLAFALTSSVM